MDSQTTTERRSLARQTHAIVRCWSGVLCDLELAPLLRDRERREAYVDTIRVWRQPDLKLERAN